MPYAPLVGLTALASHDDSRMNSWYSASHSPPVQPRAAAIFLPIATLPLGLDGACAAPPPALAPFGDIPLRAPVLAAAADIPTMPPPAPPSPCKMLANAAASLLLLY